jgi:hypothetical protein
MPCERFNIGGVTGFACTRGRRKVKRYKCKDCDFKKDAPYLCDWPMPSGKDCDRPCCADHCKEVGPDRHYCVKHQAESRQGTLF